MDSREKTGVRNKISLLFLLSGGILKTWSLTMPFLSCSSGNPHTLLIPVDNFLFPLFTFMITTLSLLNSFFTDNKARWQAWGLMLDYTLISVVFLGSGLPRGNPSLVDVSPPWTELPLLYPGFWGSTVFSLQQGLWLFLIGTIILTVGILLRYSFTTFPPIPTLIKKWGLFGIGVFIQEACFCTYFMGVYGFMGPYEGAALGSFAIYHATSWLGLLGISLLVYAGCTRDIKLHTFGLLVTTVFTFYMYYLSKARGHIPEVILIMFLGLPLYGLGVFFTGVSLLEKLSVSLSQIQERMAKNQDFVLSLLLFLCFLFTTPSPTFLILDDLLYGWLPPAVKKIGKFPYFQQNLVVGLIICTSLFMLPARTETFSLTKRETVRRALLWFGMTTLFTLLVYMKGYPESITIRATFPFLWGLGLLSLKPLVEIYLAPFSFLWKGLPAFLRNYVFTPWIIKPIINLYFLTFSVFLLDSILVSLVQHRDNVHKARKNKKTVKMGRRAPIISFLFTIVGGLAILSTGIDLLFRSTKRGFIEGYMYDLPHEVSIPFVKRLMIGVGVWGIACGILVILCSFLIKKEKYVQKGSVVTLILGVLGFITWVGGTLGPILVMIGGGISFLERPRSEQSISIPRYAY